MWHEGSPLSHPQRLGSACQGLGQQRPPKSCHHSRPATAPLHPLSRSGNDGGATIDQGSCQFGSLEDGHGTGRDIGALSDSDPEVGRGALGLTMQDGMVKRAGDML